MKNITAKFFMTLVTISTLSTLALGNGSDTLNPTSDSMTRYFTPDTINAALGGYFGFMSKLILPVWWF